MSSSLTPEHEKSNAKVVCETPPVLNGKEKLAALRQDLDAGIADLRAGNGQPLSARHALAKIRKRQQDGDN